ncbi:MAG: spore coat protein manganese oxidase, partial [Acidobacteriaceae bacterium]|nr:spore coat protein manganese oxidase [Acidobacteriaceae bacterium]
QLTNGAFQMMQFRVASAPVRDSSQVPGTLLPRAGLPQNAAARTREMTLNEFKDRAGNPVVMLLNRTPWHMPVTETAKLGSTEIWSFVNLTDDTHPIHLHHVRFQVMDRRSFDREFICCRTLHCVLPAPQLGPIQMRQDGRMSSNARPTWLRAFTFPLMDIQDAISGTVMFRSTKLTT